MLQVDKEILPAHLKRHLASDEGEADAEFDQELADVNEKASFEVALMGFGRLRW